MALVLIGQPANDRPTLAERGGHRSRARSLDLEARASRLKSGRGLAAGGDVRLRCVGRRTVAAERPRQLISGYRAHCMFVGVVPTDSAGNPELSARNHDAD
jgi:hypothetical protein